MARKPFLVKFPPDLLESLRARAAERHEPISRIIFAAIREWMINDSMNKNESRTMNEIIKEGPA